MAQPSEFYYQETHSRVVHTRHQTTILDVNQLVKGKPAWILPTPRAPKPKTLVLADWTAFNWSADKIASVQKKLAELLDEGFTLDAWHSGEVVPLLRENLAQLEEQDFRNMMHSFDDAEVTNVACQQRRIPPKHILILNDYRLEQLLSDQLEPIPRTVKLSDVVNLRSDYHDLIKVLQTSSPPLTRLTCDDYSGRGDYLVREFVASLPNIDLEHGATTVATLTQPEVESLLSQKTLKKEIIQFGPDDLHTVEALDLSDQDITLASLQGLLGLTHLLVTLDLLRCGNLHGALVLAPNSLERLNTLKLGNSDINLESVESLLVAASHLKTLSLPQCTNLDGNLRLAVNSLEQLETLSLMYSNISLESVQSLLGAAPHTRTLDLRSCRHLQGQLTLAVNSLEQLESFDSRSSNINLESLQSVLGASQNLKSLNVAGCQNLDGTLTLIVNCLARLESFDCGSSNINLESIQSLLGAAPSLKSLDLATCQNLAGTLTLVELSLGQLESIQLPQSNISLKSLQNLLVAAPHLQTLNLANCDNLEGVLDSGQIFLRQLKELNLSWSNLSTENFQTLMDSAPQLTRLSFAGYRPGNSEWIPIEYPTIEEIDLENGDFRAKFLETLLKSTPTLRRLNLQSCRSLDTPIHLDPNSLEHLVWIDITDSDLTEENIAVLQAAAPKAQIFRDGWPINQAPPASWSSDSELVEAGEAGEGAARDGIPIDPPHDPLKQKDFKPNETEFDFKGKNKTKNQKMIVEKLSQYLTLTGQHLDSIPGLQDGICVPLSRYFMAQKPEEFDNFLNCVLKWGGEEPFPDGLPEYFEGLWDYIKPNPRVLNLPTGLQYLGDNLENYLQSHDGPFLLGNPWHSIAVKKDENSDQWLVYDPNFVDGPKPVTRENVVKTIHDTIGELVSVESPSKVSAPQIKDPNAFLENGGLLCLVQSQNAIEMLKVLPTSHSYSRKALAGLLLRDTQGVPAWVSGLHDHQDIIKQWTLATLKQFIQKNPVHWIRDLTKSIECLSEFQKENVKIQLIQLMPSDPAKTAEPLREQLMDVLQAPPQSLYYEERFKTWETHQPKTMHINEYCQTVTAKDASVTKRLIQFTSKNQLHGFSFALQDYAKHTQRPFFVIHSPDDLVCDEPFIKRDEHDYQQARMQRPPGGPLFDFFEANKGKSPILLVNYDAFDTDDLVRLNALLDKQRKVDKTPVPEDTLVIGLIDTNKPDCYQGSDFYGRFDHREACPCSSDELHQAIPILPVIETVSANEKAVPVNLFHAADWEVKLLGRPVLKGNRLEFEEGLLAAALKEGNVLEIQNGPWSDPDFDPFWQRACHLGYIDYVGLRITLPKNFKMIKSDGYHWEFLKSAVRQVDTQDVGLEVLNPHRLPQFFSRDPYDDETKTLTHQTGFIKASTGKPLNVHLTRSLDLDEWAMLLTECNTHHVTLNVTCAPGVSVPDELEFKPTIAPVLSDWDKTSKPFVIASTDMDATVARITEKDEWQVIDVSECSPSDLLQRLDANFNKETLLFEFKQTNCALLEGLQDKKRILLKGKFSPELADGLAAFLLEHKRSRGKGELMIVTRQPELFSYLDPQQHIVPAEEKWSCQGAKDPLNWAGLKSLPPRDQQLKPFDPKTSATEAAQFMKARKDAINLAYQSGPYVCLTGLSGVGKTTFVTDVLREENDTLRQGDDQLEAWAKADNPGPGFDYLFIDEVALSARQWSEFEGLWNKPPGILVNGQYCLIKNPEKKRLIFATNPVSYGDERRLASLFERHGRALVFDPLPTAVLYEDILKPVFENSGYAGETLSYPMLEVYRFLVSCSTTDVLISPRELQMMALLTVSYCRHHPEAKPEEVALHYAMTLAKPLVPTDKLASFNQSFQSNFQRPVPAQKGEVVGEDFVLTPSRYPIRQLLDDLLTLRASRQAHPNENRAQVYGGLGGIILEGEPGVGKTELVLNTLIEHGFHEVHHLDAPLTTDKPFYRMPVSLSISEKKALLLKAFDEGAVVVIDEINSSPMMEQFLNDLLMGIHPETKERPKKPGFFIIGTQNPITMGGRRAPSTALSRRMITVEVTPYSTAEMHQILVWKGLSEEDTTLLVRAFNKQEQFARHNKLKPAPTFRDLLMVADEILRQLAEVVSEIPPDLSSPQTHTTPAAEQTLTNLSSPLTTSPLSEKVDLSTASTKHPSPTESVLSHELSPASPDAKSTPNRFVEAMRKLADTDLKRQYPSKARRFKYDIVDAMLKKFEAEAGTSHIPEDILKKRPFTLDELDLKDQADFFGWEAGQTYTLSDAFDLHRHHYKPDRPTASTKRIERETNPEKMNASATEFLNDLEKRLRRLKTPARVAKAEQVRAWLDSIEHVTFPDLETLCRHTSGDKNLLQILQTQTSKKKKDASFETRSYKAFCQRFHLKDHVDVEEILRPTDGSSMTI